MPQMKDFLNPKSMLTPGIAGGLTVSISMTLVNAFNLKFTWVSLSVSFLFGLLIVLSFKESLLLRCLYGILNSLIIFSVSFGAGKTVDPPLAPPKPPSSIENLYKKTIGTSKSDKLLLLEPSAVTGAETKSTNMKGESLEKYLQQIEQYNESQEKYNRKWSW